MSRNQLALSLLLLSVACTTPKKAPQPAPAKPGVSQVTAKYREACEKADILKATKCMAENGWQDYQAMALLQICGPKDSTDNVTSMNLMYNEGHEEFCKDPAKVFTIRVFSMFTEIAFPVCPGSKKPSILKALKDAEEHEHYRKVKESAKTEAAKDDAMEKMTRLERPYGKFLPKSPLDCLKQAQSTP
jgi:hypothetical protein